MRSSSTASPRAAKTRLVYELELLMLSFDSEVTAHFAFEFERRVLEVARQLLGHSRQALQRAADEGDSTR